MMEKKKKLLENFYSLYAVSAYILNADGKILEQYGENAMEDVRNSSAFNVIKLNRTRLT